MYLSFGLHVLDWIIYIIVATVSIELQTWSKVLQMHLSQGGGTPWLQPKSIETFILA